jgi:hypothetical protein
MRFAREKSFFRACTNRSPRRVHTVLQLENEEGVIEKKTFTDLAFSGKTVVNSSFGISTCFAAGTDSSRQPAHMRAPTHWAPNSFLKKTGSGLWV